MNKLLYLQSTRTLVHTKIFCGHYSQNVIWCWFAIGPDCFVLPRDKRLCCLLNFLTTRMIPFSVCILWWLTLSIPWTKESFLSQRVWVNFYKSIYTNEALLRGWNSLRAYITETHLALIHPINWLTHSPLLIDDFVPSDTTHTWCCWLMVPSVG